MRKLILGAALLSLVAVSCRVEVNMLLDVAADGSGTISAEFGFDEEAMGLLTAGGEDISEEIFGDVDLASAPGATFGQRTEDDFTYFTATVPFNDINEANRLLEEDDGNPFGSTFSVEVTEDAVRVSASSPETDDVLGGDQFEGFSVDALDQFFSAHIRIKLPGSVKESNADRILSDGTLEWDIPLSGGPLQIEAESSLGGGGFPVGLVAGIAVAVAAIGGFLYSQRKRPAVEGAGAATPDTDQGSAVAPPHETDQAPAPEGGEAGEEQAEPAGASPQEREQAGGPGDAPDQPDTTEPRPEG